MPHPGEWLAWHATVSERTSDLHQVVRTAFAESSTDGVEDILYAVLDGVSTTQEALLRLWEECASGAKEETLPSHEAADLARATYRWLAHLVESMASKPLAGAKKRETEAHLRSVGAFAELYFDAVLAERLASASTDRRCAAVVPLGRSWIDALNDAISGLLAVFPRIRSEPATAGVA